MKILLIDPPFQRFMGYYRFYFPLGLTYLAAVLKQAGHEVLIYDADHDPKGYSLSMKATALSHCHYLEALQNNTHYIWQEYLNILEKFMPDIVGISFLTPKVGSALKIARLTKQHRSDIIVVAGGEHVTARPQDALGKNIDYVVEKLISEKIPFLAQVIGECRDFPDLKQIFSKSSPHSFLITEYVQRCQGFAGFFTKTNVGYLTKAAGEDEKLAKKATFS